MMLPSSSSSSSLSSIRSCKKTGRFSDKHRFGFHSHFRSCFSLQSRFSHFILASLLAVVHFPQPSQSVVFGEVSGYEGCFTDADWYAYATEKLVNVTVAKCAEKCYVDGFRYAVMHSGAASANASAKNECDCACNIDALAPLSDEDCTTLCTSADSLVENSYDYQCPSTTDAISVFMISVPELFCEVNALCEEAAKIQGCQNVQTLVLAVTIGVLGVLVIVAVIFCCCNRDKLCRPKRPSKRVTRQILQDQLMGPLSAESLVESVQQSWVIDFHKITMGKLIAAGSSGQVYAGVFDGKPVAVKELFSVLFDPQSLQDFKDEASMLASLHHPHIVRFFGVATRSTERGPAYYLITELKEQSLRSYMNSNQQPDRLVILRMASEIVSAIAFLHARGVVHRDLKPENVLLDQFLSVFLCDFGIAKRIDGSQRAVDMTSDMGTAAYMAPELASSKLLDDVEDEDLVIKGSFGGYVGNVDSPQSFVSTEGVELSTMNVQPHHSPSAKSLVEAKKKSAAFKKVGKKVVISMAEGSKIDIFAFGMLLYSMCAWKPPFSGHRPLQILAFISLQNRRPSLTSIRQFPQTVRDVIEAAWAQNPEDRPSCDQLKAALNKCRAELVNGEGPKLLH